MTLKFPKKNSMSKIFHFKMSSDLEGRLICKSGDILGARYRVIDKINDGTFSDVYYCIDTKNQNQIVIKCYRDQNYYKESAIKEIKVMKALNKLSKTMFVPFLGSFNFKGHVCVLFEKFGNTLLDALIRRNFSPFSIHDVKAIMSKISNALKLLHHNGIIHTDLKLENILLPNGFDVDHDFGDDEEPSSSPINSCENSSDEASVGFNLNLREKKKERKKTIDVRLIDFGSFEQSVQWHMELATTQEYRAPEILMGLQWGIECDIWSLGCILVQLSTGRIDFASKSEIEQLFLIQHMISPLPKKMFKQTPKKEICEALSSYLINPAVFDPKTRKELLSMPTLSEILNFNDDLNDLAHKMLNPDPSKRINIDEVLEHKFLKFE